MIYLINGSTWNRHNIADEGQSEMSEVKAGEMDIEGEIEEEEDETEMRKSLNEWLKSWEKKEKLSDSEETCSL